MTEADKIHTYSVSHLLTRGQLVLMCQSSVKIHNHSLKAVMVGRKNSDSMLLELLKPQSAPFTHQLSQTASGLTGKSGQKKEGWTSPH